MKKPTMTFIGCEKEYEDADIVLFGAPFDGTTSYRPGTRFAPSAIRNESYGIETYSPYQDIDLEDLHVFDSGDIDLPFGNPSRVLQRMETHTQKILQDKKIPFMIGGEHLVTLGAMRAIYQTYPDVHVMQLDAHADLRDDYLGEKLSHACVMRRIWEMVGDHRIYQFGIRSGERSEFAFAKQHTQMCRYDTHTLKDVIAQLQDVPVYVTIDLDVLDPSIFCGTGTPEAGGIFYQEMQAAIEALKPLHIVGLDVNELSPTYDASGVSTAVACKVIRELLCVIGGKENE